MAGSSEPVAGGHGQGSASPRETAEVGAETGAADLRPGSWLEVFFDLVFAAAIAQLAQILSRDPTLAGFGRFAALFVVVWWAWVGYTFYNNRFPREDLPYRLIVVVAMAAAASLAADAAGAFGPRSAAFALSYAVLSGLLALLYARSRGRGPAHHRRLVSIMLASHAISASAWTVSVFVPAPWRYGLWALGLAVEIAVPLVGGSLLRPVDGRHLPERFGTFVIIVLGQVVVAAILGISAVHRDARSVAAGALGFIIAVAIWWGYFDFVAFAARYGLLRAKSHGTLARDIYAYGHLPIVFGISLTGVGVWMAIAQSTAAVISPPGRLFLLGGLLLVYLGNGAVSWGVTRSLRGSVSWPRTVAAVALLLLIALGGYVSPVVLLVLIDVTLVASLALEVTSERRFGLRLRRPRGPGSSER